MANHSSNLVTSGDHARLISLLEGTLTASEFRKLESEMKKRPELRSAWIKIQDQESELKKHFSEPRPSHVLKAKRFSALWVALAVATVFAAGFLFRYPAASTFTSVDLPGVEGVAIVSKLEGVNWKGKSTNIIEVGTYLKPGTLNLTAGSIELIFLSGASVAIEGPAEVQILSEKLAYLNRGKAAARVPEEAIGFTLKTPDAAIVDVGTGFAAEVDSSGKSLVHVYDGEVHVSLLGEDGATLSGARLLKGDAASVNPETHDLVTTENRVQPILPRVSTQDHSLLVIPEKYRETVLASNPVVNWNFEQATLNGKTTGGVKTLTSNGNHAVYFDQNGYISTIKPVPGLNLQDYSIEFWVKPDRFHYATLFGMFHEEPNQSKPTHLNVIELMHESHLIHRPNSIRFLHRWPNSQNTKSGEVNAFAETSFIPGRWMHIAAIKKTKSIELYIDGQLSRTIEKISENHTKNYHLVLGQIDSLRSARKFSGIIDELALYRQALTSGEISERYLMIKEANPDQFTR